MFINQERKIFAPQASVRASSDDSGNQTTSNGIFSWITLNTDLSNPDLWFLKIKYSH